MDNLLKFLLYALATYRIGLLITNDDWPFGIMWKIREKSNMKALEEEEDATGLWWSIRDLLNCPLCIGIWITPIVYFFFPEWLLWLFAIAGLQSFLSLMERE